MAISQLVSMDDSAVPAIWHLSRIRRIHIVFSTTLELTNAPWTVASLMCGACGGSVGPNGCGGCGIRTPYVLARDLMNHMRTDLFPTVGC